MLGYCVLLVVMGCCNIIFAFSGPFAKSVSKFFKSLQPSYREQQRKSREDKYKLNNEEASIVEQAVGAKLGQDYDIPALDCLRLTCLRILIKRKLIMTYSTCVKHGLHLEDVEGLLLRMILTG